MTRVYEARVERVAAGWVAEFPNLNWGFLHTDEGDGGRATLEAHVRQTITELEGDKDFYVAYDFLGDK